MNSLTPAQRVMAGAMTEDELLTSVIERAQQLGWLVAHFRPAKTSKGWRTAVQGDGAGFPDLVLVHPVQCRVVVAELKSEKGKTTGEQMAWLTAFTVAGVKTHIWRPSDWLTGAIDKALRGAE